jgi:hypothetical protein
MDADQQLAIAHYRMMFPNAAALGTDAADWLAEYNRVSSCGLAATLITGSTFEGGGATGQRNFSQTVLIQGLLIVRAELDPLFDDVAFAPPKIRRRQRMGITVQFGTGSGSYATNGNY